MDEEREGNFAEGEEDEASEENTDRGTFAEGQTERPDPKEGDREGFFAEGEADEESEKDTHRGSFGDKDE
jgi:hypothetical protein